MEKTDEPKLGKTNTFPRGKLNESDEGGLTTAISHENGKVVINYGTPVVWIGMDPQGAADFASTILKHAKAAAKEAKIPLSIMIV